MIHNAFERRTAILDYLRAHARASTRELSAKFAVSEVTIRSDLDNLEAAGRLVRRHGGAELALPPAAEQTFTARSHLHLAEKKEIARAAAQTIQAGDHILFDASTTAYQLAWEIRERSDLVVVTNNVQAALLLASNPTIEVLLVGGHVRGDNWSVVGMLALEMLGRIHARRGFFGAAGLTAASGLTDADQREVQIKRAMVVATDEVTVLLDSSKFGQRALLTFASLAEVDHIVTDTGVTPDYVEMCRNHDVRLTVA